VSRRASLTWITCLPSSIRKTTAADSKKKNGISRFLAEPPCSRADSRSAGGVHAGDRLPWIEGTDNFAPLASLDWQVHVSGTAPAALREFATGVKLPLHEWPWMSAARRSGLERDAFYLAHPDGHIGFARREADVAGLRAYLGRFGIISP
jgi:hypothetical protein